LRSALKRQRSRLPFPCCTATNSRIAARITAAKPAKRKGARRRPISKPYALRVHRLEELGIALGAAELVEQEVDGVHRAHWIEDAAEHVHLLQHLRIGDQLFL